MMHQYSAGNLKIAGTNVTLDIQGKGTLTADMADWEDLITNIGGVDNIKRVKLLGDDMLEFPNNVHIEIEDFVNLAEKQSKKHKVPASFKEQLEKKYTTK